MAYVIKLSAASGKLAVAGYCWGGSQTFRFATNRKDPAAAFVFYGSGPTSEEELARIACPVYGFYGGNDARVNATIPQATELMTKLGKTYEPVTYEGAGHGFMRAGESNRKAREEGWKGWKEVRAAERVSQFAFQYLKEGKPDAVSPIAFTGADLSAARVRYKGKWY